jgi:glycosyltransferase involved in cell wall biosynthesis
MTPHPINCVVVMVCTRDRLALLADAVASIEAQQVPDGVTVKIVIADNSEHGDEVAIRLMCPRAHYVHEPRRGYSNIRNAAIATALVQTAADVFLFVDDDDIHSGDMLAQHLVTFAASGADVSAGVGGPTGIKNRSPAKYVGTANVAFRRWIAERCRFCSEANLLGAEDLEFFHDAAKLGAKMVYSTLATHRANPRSSELCPPAPTHIMRRMNARNRIVIARQRRGLANALSTYARHFGGSVIPNLVKGSVRYVVARVTNSERRRLKALQTLDMHRGAIEGFFLPGLDRDMAKRGRVVAVDGGCGGKS